MIHLKGSDDICVENYIFNHSSCFVLKIGKSKVNKNLPAGISGRNGVENEILVGEDSLETFGSSLETEETNRCRFAFFSQISLLTFHYENIFRQFVHFKFFSSLVISMWTFTLQEHTDAPVLLQSFNLLNLTVVPSVYLKAVLDKLLNETRMSVNGYFAVSSVEHTKRIFYI